MENHTQVVSNVIGCAARKFFSIHKILVMRYFSIQTVKTLASLATILKAGCFVFFYYYYFQIYTGFIISVLVSQDSIIFYKFCECEVSFCKRVISINLLNSVSVKFSKRLHVYFSSWLEVLGSDD